MTDFQQRLVALLSPYLDADLQSLLDESVTESRDRAGHMDSGLTDSALAGQIVAALHQGNLLTTATFPKLARAGQETLDFFFRLFGFAHGHFTSGGSEANLEALWYARRAHPARRLVYGSRACHYSIRKACEILGLEFQIIDSSAEVMDVAKLAQACETTPPLAVVLNAGTTSAGMLDPLSSAITVSHQHGAYCHIDAAWGGFLAFDGRLPAAVSQADSLCFDPHKSLSQPKPCSMLLYQQPPVKAGAAESPYLESPPPLRVSGSSGGERFLGLWLSLHQDNGEQLRQRVRQQTAQATHFSQWLQQRQLPCLAGAANIVCFQLPPRAHHRLAESARFSSTEIDGDHWFRAVFSRPGINAEALIRAVAAVL